VGQKQNMEKFLENIESAERSLKTVDHMVYITFPLIKDKRILLKVIQEIKTIITSCIKAILQYEYLYKRIKLYKNPESNFKTFIGKCSKRYDIDSEEIKTILEIFDYVEKHKESPFEFVKGEKIIILSESLNPKILTLEKIKSFLFLAKNILKKTKENIIQDS
jgi:hypothetical protein